MADKPNVTVIVPTYNAMPYLPEAVESALQDSRSEFAVEVIIVDDGSVDSTSEYLDSLKARPDVAIFTQNNSGGAVARAMWVSTTQVESSYSSLIRTIICFPERSRTCTVKHGGLTLKSSSERWKALATVRPRHRCSPRASTTLSSSKTRYGRPSARGSYSAGISSSDSLRFPTDMVIGEDQVFVSQAYLAAERVAVLADRSYYHFRPRDDGRNVTSRVQSSTRSF